MSTRPDPMAALREITQKKQPVIKTDSSDRIYSRYKYFKPDLTLDTQSIAENSSFNEEQPKKEQNSNPKVQAPRASRPGIVKGQGFTYFKAEDIWNRVSPQTRLPSRDSYNPQANQTQNYFVSKNKERADAQDVCYLIKNRLEKGYQFFGEDGYQDALLSFSQCESLIERNCNLDKKVPFDLVFLTFYNMISTHYKLKNLDEALSYTNNTLLNLQLSKEYRNGGKKGHYNFNNTQDQIEYLKKKAHNSQYHKHKCKALLQACIINSENEKHTEALVYARDAAKEACKLITQSLLICYKMFLRYKEIETSNRFDMLKRLGKSDMNSSNYMEESGYGGYRQDEKSKERLNSNDSKSSINSNTSIIHADMPTAPSYNDPLIPMTSNNMTYIEKLIPILEEIVNKITHPKSPPQSSNQSRLLFYLRRLMKNYQLPEIDMNHLYEGLPENHFLFTSNIMAVIQLKPLKESMLKESKDLFEEIQPDKIIEQILLVVTSLYAISTEFRFWDDSVGKSTDKSSSNSIANAVNEYFPKSILRGASELWIGRSLEVAYVYLPHDCPLADQIFNIYSRLYTPTKFIIPEDEEPDQDLKYLYPARGVSRSNQFFIPLIKTIQSTDLNSLLTLEHDITDEYLAQIRNISILDPQSKFYSLLQKNYQLETYYRQGSSVGKRSSNSQLTKIYGNVSVTRNANAAARKKPIKSPSDREDSAKRFRFPPTNENANVNASFEGSRGTPTSAIQGHVQYHREKIPKISLKQNNFFASPEQPKPGSSQSKSDPSRHVSHSKGNSRQGPRKNEIQVQEFVRQPDSADGLRASQEREYASKRTVLGSASSQRNGGSSSKGKMSSTQEGFRNSQEKIKPQYIKTSNINQQFTREQHKGKVGCPPSPKTLDQRGFNWNDSRKVDININNNISVIINNNNVSPNHQFHIPHDISDEPLGLEHFQPKSGSAKGASTFKGDPLSFMPTKIGGGVIPKPPKNDDTTRFKRLAKPQKPQSQANDSANNNSSGDRPFRRKMFTKDGIVNSMGSANNSRNNSKENDRSNYSHGTNDSDHITQNILDALIDDDKNATGKGKTTTGSTKSGIPPRVPVKVFDRVKRPTSRTKLDASRISPSNSNNRDLTFKFEDSELIDVDEPAGNQSAILAHNNDNSFSKIGNKGKLDQHNISADLGHREPMVIGKPKSSDKKIRIRRVKAVESK